MYGKCDWFFPDAELPPKGENAELFGHESFIFFNPNPERAQVRISLYYTDRAPVHLAPLTLEGERVRCVRAVEGAGLLGTEVVLGEQYAVAVHSTVPIIAQYGRLDMRTGTMAFYTTPGYAE